MGMGIEGIHHIGVSVPDLDLARQFFCRLGRTQIEVFEYSRPVADPQDPDRGVHQYGYTHIALQVGDLDACVERLLAAGIRFHNMPDKRGIAVAEDGSKSGYAGTYCRDWFGNVFELLEIHPGKDSLPI